MFQTAETQTTVVVRTQRTKPARLVTTAATLKSVAIQLIEANNLQLECEMTTGSPEFRLHFVNARDHHLTGDQLDGIAQLRSELRTVSDGQFHIEERRIPEGAQQFTLVQLRFRAK